MSKEALERAYLAGWQHRGAHIVAASGPASEERQKKFTFEQWYQEEIARTITPDTPKVDEQGRTIIGYVKTGIFGADNT